AVRFRWVATAFENYARQKPASDPAHFVLTTGFYVTPLVCAAAIVGSAIAWRRRNAFFLFVPASIAIVLLGALAASTLVRVSAQYVFVILPWFAILACAPLDDLSGAAAPDADGSDGDSGNEARTMGGLRCGWLALLLMPALATLSL